MNNQEDRNSQNSRKDDIPHVKLVLPEKTKKFNFPTKMVNPKAMSRRAFFYACKYKEMINILFESKSIDNILHAEHFASLIGLTCEIFLKSLLYYQQKASICEFESGHDLDDLYDKISDPVKNILLKCFLEENGKRITKAELEEAIKRNNSAFVLFRYEYECNGTVVEMQFMRILMEALYQTCKKVIIANTFA